MTELFIKDTASTLEMLRKEVPLQIEMIASLTATRLNENERRANQKKAIAHFEKKVQDNPEDLQLTATLERLNKELKNDTYKTPANDTDIDFSKESLRKRLHVIFGAHLAFLEENDAEGFKQAEEIIEKGITDSKKILTKVKKILGMVKRKSASTVESVAAKRAIDFFAPVDKVTKKVFDRRENSIFYENPAVLVEVGKKGGKPVMSVVSINIDELKNVTLSNDVMLNPYNRAVHNIAVSLFIAGNTHFTPNMIYQAMTGNSATNNVPEKIRQEIMESMRKLIHTFIKIDAAEEAKAFGLDKLKFEGYLMPAELVTAQINGQEIECFKFLREPPLYTYASKKKQVSHCDINLLAVDLNMTQDNIFIRDYLLEQITSFKSKKSKLLNVIRYDTLYEYLGLEAPTKETLIKKKQRVRSKILTILNMWKHEGFILGYEEQREGTAFAKVRIFLQE